MTTRYPAAIDTVFTLKPILDGQPVSGGSVEQLREAILVIQEELGVKPSAVYATVRGRLDTIEGIVGNLQVISLNGDLGGTLEIPKVIGIHGRPVSTVPPQPGEAYVWDGIAWTPGTVAANVHFGGDLSGNAVTQKVIGINEIPVEHGTGANVGQFLKLKEASLGFITANHFDGQYLWLLSLDTNHLYKVDSAVPEIVSTIQLPLINNPIGQGLGNYITSDSNHIYVSIIANDPGQVGRLYIIEKTTNNIVGQINAAFAGSPSLIWGVAVYNDHIMVSSGGSATFTTSSDNDTQIDRYSKTEVLSSYPIPGTPNSTILPSAGNAYRSNMVIGIDEGVPRLYVNGYSIGFIYQVDFNSGPLAAIVVYTASGPSGKFGNMAILDNYVYVGETTNPSPDAPTNQVFRFLTGAFGFGPITTTSGAFGTYMVSDGSSVWVSNYADDSLYSIVGSKLIRLDNIGTIIAQPTNVPITYSHLASDGTWIWASQVIDSGTPGVDAFSTGLGTEAFDHNFSSISGDLRLVYANAGGSNTPLSTLIYRPGGAASGNVYTSWTNLMSARSTITGPATIIIDDSITSPAPIDVGTWNLGKNTKLIGWNGLISPSNAVASMSVLVIPSDAQLLNASEFEDIIVIGENNTTPCIIFSGLMNIKARSTIFKNQGGQPLFYIDSSSYADYHIIELYESSSIVHASDNPVFQSVTGGVYQFKLYDQSNIDGYTIKVTDGSASVEVYINSGSAFFDSYQPGTFVFVTVYGTNMDPSGFSSAPNDYILIKSGIGTATWQPGFAAGGDLAGSNTYQQVHSISGNVGVSPYLGLANFYNIQTFQSHWAPTSTASLDSFVLDVSVSGTGSQLVIFTLPVPVTNDGVMDAKITFVCKEFSNSLNMYRADLQFTAIVNGGALSTIVQSGNPINARSNGTLSGVAMNVVQSGNNVLIRGTFPAATTFTTTGYFQLQWRVF